MALGPCRACRTQVSVTALACPRCGAENPLTATDLAAFKQRQTRLSCLALLAFMVFLIYQWSESQSDIPRGDAADRSPEGNRTAKEIGYIDLQQDRVRQKLKDPESGTFRNARVYYSMAPVVCGEVNAKNSFGGKGGYQRFISGGTIQVLEEEMAAGEMDQSWAQICR